MNECKRSTVDRNSNCLSHQQNCNRSNVNYAIFSNLCIFENWIQFTQVFDKQSSELDVHAIQSQRLYTVQCNNDDARVQCRFLFIYLNRKQATVYFHECIHAHIHLGLLTITRCEHSIRAF
ncbi:hypothetical protein Tsp_01753 [Trichinella spiralis]|uniref:hypothetical protein n=1 Tax=Trichinella spiralis TaxID=6334 RepID=UPI0001EFCA8A|nr:hypothetical protein Tsp_01753 [Trichinella spiralis]